MRWLLLLLIPLNSFAGSGGTYWKFGLGIDSPSTSTKIIATGYQGPLWHVLDYQLEVGMFNDNNQSQGLIGFMGASVGVSVVTHSGFYSKLFAGPALITQTDSRLSSILEFNEDLELGLINDSGVSIGADLKHMSNAGLWPPNIGRDFLLLKVQIPF